jgi:crossover junction endodeoxyribonuclease RuvC
MRIIGIDAGFASLGWAVVDIGESVLTPIMCGVIRTEKATKKVQVRSSEDNIKRAQVIYKNLVAIIGGSSVKLIATESMSWPRNAGVVAKMGIVWGVIASVAEVYNLPVIQSSPMEIKRKVTGDGKSNKERMIAEIRQRFPTLSWPTQETLHEHVADAVGAVIACQESEYVKWASNQNSSPLNSLR